MHGKEDSTTAWERQEWSGRASWRREPEIWALRMVWKEIDGEWSCHVSWSVSSLSSQRQRRVGVLGSPALLLLLGNNSASLGLPSSSVQWASQPCLPRGGGGGGVATRIRQDDVGKEPDTERVTRAQPPLVGPWDTECSCLTHRLQLDSLGGAGLVAAEAQCQLLSLPASAVRPLR